jgi:hypothetical protein
MEHSPTLDQVVVPQPLPRAPQPRPTFSWQVVLLALGYFLIWPVLLLLIIMFLNAAGDWFVEPRTWG